MQNIESKKCCCCKELLPKIDFSLNKSTRDGLQTTCKKCTSKQQRQNYKIHREKRLLDMKAYYESNKICLMEKQKKWNEQNIEKVRNIKNNYNKRNRNQINERRNKSPAIYRKWEKNNPEQIKKLSTKSRQKQRELLSDSYVKQQIAARTNLKSKDIPQAFIDVYKEKI